MSNKSLSMRILSKQGNISELIDNADDHKMRKRNEHSIKRTDSNDSITSLENELVASMKAYGDDPEDDRIKQWKIRKKHAEKTPSTSPLAKKRSPSPPAKKRPSSSPSPSRSKKNKNGGTKKNKKKTRRKKTRRKKTHRKKK